MWVLVLQLFCIPAPFKDIGRCIFKKYPFLKLTLYLLFKWTGSNIGIMQKFTSINAVLVTPVFQFDGLDKQTYVIKFIIGLLKNNRN